MLRQLHVRNLAVIEEVVLDFSAGFTALTGETGAGKSILIDALALALGERSDTLAIRAGAPRLEVSALFDPGASAAATAWLRDNELLEEGDGECVLRRVVGSEGRSKAWINGRPVPVQSLRELGALLVDICGQQDYQSLRHRAVQREVLDATALQGDLKASVNEAYRVWQSAESERRQLLAIARDRDSRRDLLSFQVNELALLDTRTGEFAHLEREHRALSHRARIADALARTLARAYDDEQGSAQEAVTAARRALEDVVTFDAELDAPLRLLAEADILIREATGLTRQRLAALDQDPDRETEFADRMAALQDVARKHRVTPDELPATRERLEAELRQLTDYEQTLATLGRQAADSRARLGQLANALSAARRTAAAVLGGSVTKNMAALGMAGGRFEVRVEPLGGDGIGPDGADEVEFLVTTNAGQPAAPMSRVASGGELSRLNLAIQVVATAARGAPTLVFDEVDAGVGGAVAEIVGRQLRELARGRQVLCITHLPQVATLAQQHATISKLTRGGRTTTTVQMLSAEERVEETARMLGGVRITEQTRAHAREMLEAANAASGEPPPGRTRARRDRASRDRA